MSHSVDNKNIDEIEEYGKRKNEHKLNIKFNRQIVHCI